MRIDLIRICLNGGTDLEAVDVEVKPEGLYDHGRPLPQRLPTAGAQLLPTD